METVNRINIRPIHRTSLVSEEYLAETSALNPRQEGMVGRVLIGPPNEIRHAGRLEYKNGLAHSIGDPLKFRARHGLFLQLPFARTSFCSRPWSWRVRFGRYGDAVIENPLHRCRLPRAKGIEYCGIVRRCNSLERWLKTRRSWCGRTKVWSNDSWTSRSTLPIAHV